MMDQESSPSSWLLRARFSRAICYRPGTCNTSSWLNLSSKETIPYLGTTEAKELDKRLASFIKHAPSLDAYYHAPSTPSEDNHHEDSTEGGSFSFLSPFSSASASRLSDSSVHSKSASDCFSPCRDDDMGAEMAPAEAPTGSNSTCYLRSVLNSLSTISSRWSFSTDSFHEKQEQSSNSSFKGSWFSRFSPKSSTKVSPQGSPVVSPKGSPKGSPRSSFRYSTCTQDSINQDCAASEARSDMHRVPSWSHHLSNAGGGESAVLSAETWMIDLSQLLLGDRFACGNHSRLYHGIYRESPVAVKVIRQPDDDGLLADRLEEIFTREVTTLSCLQHHNVIKFVAACKKPPVLCVITEYLPGGSLRSFLHKREGQLLPLPEVLRMALNIASGMEYLHMKGVIHRDLKSENLVLGEDGCVKIVDFGVSCFESKCNYRADDSGTYRWMAPEMLRHEPYTRKVDVYSFGIVLWELLTARLPYEDMGAVQAAFCVLHKNTRPPIPPDCPALLEDLMCRCWCTDPNTRPEFWEILRSLTMCEQSVHILDIPTLESPEHDRYLTTWLESE